MIKTRLTELVGIKYPIIQAGMGPYPVTSLCIAAANAGCLGLCSTFATASRETNKVVFDDFSTIPMDLLTFERVGVAATYAGDVEHAMAGAGECAQRITDLPKTADMVKKCVDDAEEILKGISGKYLA